MKVSKILSLFIIGLSVIAVPATRGLAQEAEAPAEAEQKPAEEPQPAPVAPVQAKAPQTICSYTPGKADQCKNVIQLGEDSYIEVDGSGHQIGDIAVSGDTLFGITADEAAEPNNCPDCKAAPNHEVAATYKIVNGDAKGYGGQVSADLRFKPGSKADVLVGGSLGGVGQKAIGSAYAGVEFLGKRGSATRLEGKIFTDLGLLTAQSGLKITAIRRGIDGKLIATLTPIGYDYNRLNKTGGAFTGVGVGAELKIPELFTVSGMLDATLGYGQGRDLIIETEYISPTERNQKIVRTGMVQDGPNAVLTARGALKRSIGSGRLEVYGEVKGRSAQFNETGFEGMVLNTTNANNRTEEVGVTAVLPF